MNQHENPPTHIAIIMDGNGRWAKQRGLPREMGHKAGAKAAREIARHCQALGVSSLTLYAFSTENWSRPEAEVRSIMNLLREYLSELDRYRNENIRVIILGDTASLDQDLKNRIADVQQQSAHNTGMILNIALNYGGRQELTRAVCQIAEQVAKGAISPSDITEHSIASQLYTAGQPDPDLIIRPSGEYRLSNFLLWQCAYSEFVFMDVLWPDFSAKELDRAIAAYTQRNRRFGGI